MQRGLVLSTRRASSWWSVWRFNPETRRPTPTVPAVRSERTLFSSGFLGVDSYQYIRKRRRLTVDNLNGFKSAISARFDESGIQSIFGPDLLQLQDAADDKNDLELIRKILSSFLDDENRVFVELTKILTNYFILCKVFNDLEGAKRVWNSQGFQRSHQLLSGNSNTIRLCYLTLLYEMGQYEEAVKVIEDFGLQNNPNEVTVGLGCLAKIGTKNALVKAKSWLPATSGDRAIAICCWLAMSLGEMAMAYDLLPHRRVTGLLSNLKLAILVEVGRIEDAFVLIRADFLGWRSSICYEVMEKLAKQVTDQDLKLQFSQLCSALDSSSILSDNTLTDLVFQPIRKSQTDSERRTFPKRHKRNRSLGYDDCD